ncbi:PREDICTED: putative RNA-binding protein Luc7-like 1 [Priapulus caudatus]|uniref:RNA-binding protein Luc7-like 1 n=1 Tax=Priapulus caudatus TaxID=37621 RepID=A0ABM1F9W0_PRICU|nr:PREDICTED: putative RNA-binding protein Luc7-like 1 [Priapulus caudatus]
MSAQEQMRNMLDQLMGTQRDGASKTTLKYTDSRVCRSFLLSCCPYDILSSTRLNLGSCTKHHDLALRADYEMAAKTREYYYEMDAMDHLKAFVDDCDKQTEVAKKKLAETQEQLSEEVNTKLEKVHEMAESIGKTLARAEQLGAEGNVDESLKMMEEVEQLKKKKYEAEQEYRNSMPASTYQQQKLRVCEVCSAYLGIHDNDRRLADHFGGKLHLGFIEIREKLAKLEKLVEEKKVQREAQREERWAEREKEKVEKEQGRGEDEDGSKDRDREREKERDRERGGRVKDRGDRDKERKRSRSRDRGDRHRRSRSRSRSRRTRRKSRSRSPGSRSSRRSDRRSRSRSRDRRRRSRSNEKRSSSERVRPSDAIRKADEGCHRSPTERRDADNIDM